MAELTKAQIHEIAERFLAAIPPVTYTPAKGGFKGEVAVPDINTAEAAATPYPPKPHYAPKPYPKKPKVAAGILALPQTLVSLPMWEFIEPQFKLHQGYGAAAIYVHSKLKKNYQPLPQGIVQKDYGCGFVLHLKEEDLELFTNTLPKLKKQQSHAGTFTLYYSISKLVFLPAEQVMPGMYGTTQKVEVTLETEEEWQTYEMTLVNL